MKGRKKVLPVTMAVVWFIVLTVLVLAVFFPYKKAFRLVLQNFIAGNGVTLSSVDARIGFLRAQAARMVMGHQALGSEPLMEMENVRLTANPLSILGGGLSVGGDASAYGGKVGLQISKIPLFSDGVPGLTARFSGINLARYPEGRFRWVKGLKGTMDGEIRREPRSAQGQVKGAFRIQVKDGELSEVSAAGFPRLIIPFNDLAAAGTVVGDKLTIEKVSIRSPGLSLTGKGLIEGTEYDRRISLTLTYTSAPGGAPLPGSGTIVVAGSVWAPAITVTPDSPKSGPDKKTPPATPPRR